MSETSANVLLRHLQRLTAGEGRNDLSDRDLLLRYAAGRDEAAFEAILQRHGALVWGVCRRALPRCHDAEDAFQATFLTLAARVRSIRKPEALACWLHGVARRIAVRLRARAARVPLPVSPPSSAPDPLDEVSGRELCLALDEELGRLPGACRAAPVHCYLEGRTRDEAAGLLGWSVSTLKRRLQHGCRLLRARLSRRGLAPSALLATTLTARETCAAAPGLRQATLRRVLASAAGPLGRTLGARGKLTLALLLACVAGLGLGGANWHGTPPAPQEEGLSRPAPRLLDRQGDPLPPGAVARLGSARWRHGDPLPPGAVPRLGGARWRHGGQVYGLAYSSDGKLLASGGYDGSVCLWEANSGKLVRELAPLKFGLYALAFSPDGKTLVATSQGGEGAHTWEVATGKVKEVAAFSGQKILTLGYRATASSSPPAGSGRRPGSPR